MFFQDSEKFFHVVRNGNDFRINCAMIHDMSTLSLGLTK